MKRKRILFTITTVTMVLLLLAAATIAQAQQRRDPILSLPRDSFTYKPTFQGIPDPSKAPLKGLGDWLQKVDKNAKDKVNGVLSAGGTWVSNNKGTIAVKVTISGIGFGLTKVPHPAAKALGLVLIAGNWVHTGYMATKGGSSDPNKSADANKRAEDNKKAILDKMKDIEKRANDDIKKIGALEGGGDKQENDGLKDIENPDWSSIKDPSGADDPSPSGDDTGTSRGGDTEAGDDTGSKPGAGFTGTGPEMEGGPTPDELGGSFSSPDAGGAPPPFCPGGHSEF